jgi:aspartyl-tRNA(Asn)/glutamyl-tRNA(Gln) amidotransferase subunit B
MPSEALYEATQEHTLSFPEAYTVIIGLEVHVQLLTQSKLFCGCSTRFGRPPNSQTCPICIGMPGTLPMMNRRALELSLKAAVALDCQIAPFTKWDRKHYYYPDLPKNYQISQYDLPFSHDGHLAISVGKGDSPHLPDAEMGTVPLSDEPRRIGIIRVHLEEDAGKSMHDEVAGKADSRIDLNRTGTPLLEIVSQPDLRSPAEAKAYLTELKLLLNYLGVSDCNMQEGSLRVDANINLHVHAPEGKIPTPIVEVKNMNSFRSVERALAYEAVRQWDRWQETGVRLGAPGGHKTTRGWDENAQVTRQQRTKEESSDYRYFPEPDLVPVTVSDEKVDEVRNSLGELPARLRERLEETYGITPYDSDVLVNQGRPLVDYYVELADACGDGKQAANWVQQDVLRMLNERGIGIADYAVPAASLAELLRTVAAGKLTTSRGREVLSAMLDGGKSAQEAMAALGIAEVDESELELLCRELLAANPGVVADVQSGKTKAVGSLIGQAKKKNPNADPGRVREICIRLIESM